jgi:hypothetical protein
MTSMKNIVITQPRPVPTTADHRRLQQRCLRAARHATEQIELRIIGRRYFAGGTHLGFLELQPRQYCKRLQAFATATERRGLPRLHAFELAHAASFALASYPP